MYKGPVPTGQPRTLRSIAEKQSEGDRRLPDPDTQMPGTYADPAAGLTAPSQGNSTPADPRPFK